MPAGDIALTQTARGASAQALLRSDHEPIRSLYIHIPFCSHKCHYCDFYSFVDTQDRQEAFTEALMLELRALASVADASRGRDGRPLLRTIFVGGGTPSLLAVSLWERILATLHDAFDMGAIRRGEEECEFTVECNPESASAELFRALREGGVDRVSMGAQSFHAAHLRTLERRHEPGSVPRALALAAEAGIERRSVDLIYGVPGQTLDEWRADVEGALALRPSIEHISCYALTYEPNTAMTKRLEKGEFTRCDDGLEASMYEWLVARLGDEGFSRYEVSNFARDRAPGARETRSLHNLAYWRHESWLASGPSASGHARLTDPALGGWRWKNVPRLEDWLRSVESSGGWGSVVDVESPDPRRAIAERLMMGLRIAEGLDEAALVRDAARCGADAPLASALARQVEIGRLERREGRIAPTESGYLFADAIARDLMRALRQPALSGASGAPVSSA